MKKIMLSGAYVLLTFVAFSQSDTSKKTLQPIKTTPVEVADAKLIYELPAVCDYKVYDQKGALIEENTGQFVDYTAYAKGVYFILYNNKRETFTRE